MNPTSTSPQVSQDCVNITSLLGRSLDAIQFLKIEHEVNVPHLGGQRKKSKQN